MGVVGLQENQKEILLPLNYKQTNNISNLRQYGAMPKCCDTREPKGTQAIWINAKITNVVIQENLKELRQYGPMPRNFCCPSIVEFVDRQITWATSSNLKQPQKF